MPLKSASISNRKQISLQEELQLAHQEVGEDIQQVADLFAEEFNLQANSCIGCLRKKIMVDDPYYDFEYFWDII